MRDALYPEIEMPLLMLLAAVATLLAVACSNVANVTLTILSY